MQTDTRLSNSPVWASKDRPDTGSTSPTGVPIWPDFMAREPGRPVRVVLIDDDPVIRAKVAAELNEDPRIDLVGEADGAKAGRRLVTEREFDVMLVDLNLGDGSGFDLIEHLKEVRGHAEAIVMSVMDDEQRALRAFELGATGYLLKNTWFGQFPAAVLQVWNGGAAITPNLARRLLQRLPSAQPATNGASTVQSRVGDEEAPSLSEREVQVLKLVSLGYTSQEIGQRLELSGQTINTHIRNIYRKLQVNSRAQAVSLATRRRLI